MFQQFGEIDDVHVMTDKGISNSRVLAYIRFNRAYDAAIALETCDASKARAYCYI